ncbi:protein YLS3 [Sesamum angolense]|uniref:Protein YLS3 n=1 Tax=Sesamum angolense TaxID=2727404 RepID=A0AAE1WPT1_9LAMI|nr:protein YLS3 [Sesamum angolense]
MDSCTRTSLFLTSTLILLAITTSDNSKDRQECADSLVGLATCLPYVGGTAKTPTPDCCSGLKQVLKTNKKCLCVVIKDRNDPDLGLNINVTLALGLPVVCNAPANISQCPALLNLPPNSPDAQIFYQFGKNSTGTMAASPAAGGPSANVGPNSTSAPAGASTAGGSSQRKTSDCGRPKRWVGLEVLGGLVLLSVVIM